jgi:hypothetical protein
MPLPKPGPGEDKRKFISSCMANDKMKQEYPDPGQRYAVCSRQASAESMLSRIEESVYFQTLGSEEDVDYESMYVPAEEEYLDFGEEIEEVTIAKDGLWDNIRKKKEREGKKYKPAKPGDPDRPSKDSWKRAQSEEKKGKKVKLNSPFRTPKGPKKFSVYVKNDKNNVVKVNFGDPNMDIKRDDPARRKSFRARHQCDTNPGPKWKARYWSCRFWSKKSVTKLT